MGSTFQSAFIRKTTAVLLSVLFLLNNLSVSRIKPVFADTNQVVTAVRNPVLPEEIKIPQEWGSVLERFHGKGKRMVIHIQDAHAIPQAQISLFHLIPYLEEKYPVQAVALEGAEGPLDTSLFRSFPDRQKLTRTFQDMLEQGEISGAALAAVFSSHDTSFVGIEDWKFYEEGTQAFLNALDEQDLLMREVQTRKKRLEYLQQKYYPKEALEFDRRFQLWDAKHENPIEFLKFMKQFGTPDSKRYRILNQIFPMLDAGEENEEAFKNEIKSLISKFHPPVENVREFNQKLQAWQTRQLTSARFADYLNRYFPRSRFSAPFRKAIRIEKFAQKIRGDVFFEELNRYVGEIKSRLLKRPEERTLDRIASEIRLLKKLARFELTHPQFRELERLRKRPGIVSQSSADIASFEQDAAAFFSGFNARFNNYTRFYHTACRRDHIFLERTQKLLTPSPSPLPEGEGWGEGNTVILVTGGFHAESLKKTFRKKDISYVLIAPRIKALPKVNRYWDFMRGKVSWAEYFEIKNGRIDLFDSFSRAMVDKLLGISLQSSVLSEDRRFDSRLKTQDSRLLLKRWRDEIIRSLALRNETHKASEYTHFLDSAAAKQIFPEDLEALRLQWRSKLERFFSELKVLEKQNQISESRIAEILSSPASDFFADKAPFTHASIRASLVKPENRIARYLRPGRKVAAVRSEVRPPARQVRARKKIPANIRLDFTEMYAIRWSLDDFAATNHFRYAPKEGGRVILSTTFKETPRRSNRRYEGYLIIEVGDNGPGFQIENKTDAETGRKVEGFRTIARILLRMHDTARRLKRLNKREREKKLRMPKLPSQDEKKVKRVQNLRAGYDLFAGFDGKTSRQTRKILLEMIHSPVSVPLETLSRFLFELDAGIPRTTRDDVRQGAETTAGRGFGVLNDLVKKIKGKVFILSADPGNVRLRFVIPIRRKRPKDVIEISLREILDSNVTTYKQKAEAENKLFDYHEDYIRQPRKKAAARSEARSEGGVSPKNYRKKPELTRELFALIPEKLQQTKEKLQAESEIYRDSLFENFFNAVAIALPPDHTGAETVTVDRLVDFFQRSFRLYREYIFDASRAIRAEGYNPVFQIEGQDAPIRVGHTDVVVVANDRTGLDRDVTTVLAEHQANLDQTIATVVDHPHNIGQKVAILIFEIMRENPVADLLEIPMQLPFEESSIPLILEAIRDIQPPSTSEMDKELKISGSTKMMEKVVIGTAAVFRQFPGGVKDVAFDIRGSATTPTEIAEAMKRDINEFNGAVDRMLAQMSAFPQMFIERTHVDVQQAMVFIDEMRTQTLVEAHKPVKLENPHRRSALSIFIDLTEASMESRKQMHGLNPATVEFIQNRVIDEKQRSYSMVNPEMPEANQTQAINAQVEAFEDALNKATDTGTTSMNTGSRKTLKGLQNYIEYARERIIAKIRKENIFARVAIAEVTAPVINRMKESQWDKDVANATDLENVFTSVLRRLGGNDVEGEVLRGTGDTEQPMVLFTEHVDPFSVMRLLGQYRNIAAMVTDQGSGAAHGILVAENHNIPVLRVSAKDLPLPVTHENWMGRNVVVDGSGYLMVNPSAEALDAARQRTKSSAAYERMAKKAAKKEAKMENGRVVHVTANSDNSEEIQDAFDNGAEGVGLVRTEYLFGRGNTALMTYLQSLSSTDPDLIAANRQALIDHFASIFLDMAQHSPTGHITIRTFDLQRDKETALPNLGEPVYGADYYRTPIGADMLEIQLQAAIRANRMSDRGNVRIMFPMSRTPEDLAKKLDRNNLANLPRDQQRLNELAREDVDYLNERMNAALEWSKRDIRDEAQLRRIDGTQRGFMVESREGIAILPYILHHSDFISVGTNDLTASLFRDVRHLNLTFLYALGNMFLNFIAFFSNKLARLIREWARPYLRRFGGYLRRSRSFENFLFHFFSSVTGISRESTEDAAYFDQLQFEVLKAVEQIAGILRVENERRAALGLPLVPLAICGALAGIKRFSLFLPVLPENLPVELSVSPVLIPGLKHFIRGIRSEDSDFLAGRNQEGYDINGHAVQRMNGIIERQKQSEEFQRELEAGDTNGRRPTMDLSAEGVAVIENELPEQVRVMGGEGGETLELPAETESAAVGDVVTEARYYKPGSYGLHMTPMAGIPWIMKRFPDVKVGKAVLHVPAKDLHLSMHDPFQLLGAEADKNTPVMIEITGSPADVAGIFSAIEGIREGGEPDGEIVFNPFPSGDASSGEVARSESRTAHPSFSFPGRNEIYTAVIEGIAGTRNPSRSEIQQFGNTVSRLGVRRVKPVVETIFRDRWGDLAQRVLGIPEALAENRIDAERLLSFQNDSFNEFEGRALDHLNQSNLNFAFALPFSGDEHYRNWLGQLLAKIDQMKQSHPAKVQASIVLIAAGPELKTAENYIRSLGLASLTDEEVRIVQGDASVSSHEVNAYLQSHFNALLFSPSEFLKRNISQKQQTVDYEDSMLWYDVYPLSLRLILEAAQLREVDAAFLLKIVQDTPDGIIHFDGNHLEFRSSAREFMVRASAEQLFASMA